MKLLYLKLKDKYGGNYLFLSGVLFIYIFIGLSSFHRFKAIGLSFFNIFIYQIIPVLFIIFTFIFIFNILIEKEYIKEKIRNSNSFLKYTYLIIGGILSTGPVYMWYPFLKQLKTHGLNYGHIACFIYARAIKIPFLMVMIIYFGAKYTIIFNLIILFLSISIGITINFIFNFFNYENNNS